MYKGSSYSGYLTTLDGTLQTSRNTVGMCVHSPCRGGGGHETMTDTRKLACLCTVSLQLCIVVWRLPYPIGLPDFSFLQYPCHILQAVAALTSLECLIVVASSGVSDLGIMSLTKLTRLTHLDISDLDFASVSAELVQPARGNEATLRLTNKASYTIWRRESIGCVDAAPSVWLSGLCIFALMQPIRCVLYCEESTQWLTCKRV